MKRLTLALAASAAVTVPALAPTESATGKEPVHAPDSVLLDLEAGRFWHAARRLRAAGAQGREQTLLLARAEAGWKNWDAVVELLAGVPWLDEEDGGSGWYLLGRAYEDAERWPEAIAAYARYPAQGPEALVATVRGARARGLTGDHRGALAALDALGAGTEALVSWMALELARSAAEDGDTAAVRAYRGSVVDGGARSAAWRLGADAALAAGDTVRALAEYRSLLDVTAPSRRAVAATETALILRSSGDTAAARALLLSALEDAPAAAAGRAAAALLDDGVEDRGMAVRLGRILDRAGDGRRALRAYDVAAGRDPSAMPESARLARARLMATVRSRQGAALEEFRAIRASTQDPSIGARNLEIWAAMRRRQGRNDAVRTLTRWLLEEYPASRQATALLWTRGFDAEGRGDIAGALATYTTLVEVGGSQPRAGQARMRMGQIRLAQGRMADAAAVFDGYLEQYPESGRWEEASYWSASTHLTLGDTGLARGRVERIRAKAPLSYYAVMGAHLLSESYEVDVPEGSSPVRPGWLDEGLRRLDLLSEAGLDAGAQAEVDRMIDRSEGSPEAMLTLAEELLDRGRTVEGINLGWALRRDGQAWDRRLLKVVYPFPYRDLVVREAEEWGVDPFMLAAIIRQESAFKADIVSHAGAVGLMQVMPPTGAALARAHGPAGFDEESLTTPEVNLHLGAAFFVEMSGRYAEQLPIVLSAYNAGPTRANRWRRYPEASDPVRFTERIPFDETRGYVKNVRRNLWLYQALYGER